MSIYYLKKTGSQWEYKEAEWPDGDGTNVTDIQAAFDALDGAAPANTVVIFPGTYSGADLDSDGSISSGNINLIVGGPNVGRDGSNYVPGDVILSGAETTNNIIRIMFAGWALRDMKLTDSSGNYYCLRLEVGTDLDDIELYDGTRALHSEAGGDFTNLYVHDFDNEDGAVINLPGSSATFNNPIVVDNNGYIWHQNAATVTYNNGILFNNQTIYGRDTFSGLVTLNNCIINSQFQDNTYLVTNLGSGSFVLNNCLKNKNAHDWADTSGNVTSNDCITGFSKWIAPARQGRIFLSIDDSANWADFKTLADYAWSAYGWSLGFAYQAGVTEDSEGNPITYEELADYISNKGADIACHGWYLFEDPDDAGSIEAFTVDGNAGDTVTISTVTDTTDPATTPSIGWSGTLDLKDSGGVSYPDFPLDFGNYDTLEKIIVKINSVSGITCVITDITGKPGVKSVNLANCTGVDVSTVTGFDLDKDTWWWQEIVESKYIIEQGVNQYIPGWTCDTLIYPRGRASFATGALRDYVASKGFKQARKTNYWRGDRSCLQAAIDPFYVYSSSHAIATGISDDLLREHVADVIAATGRGLILGLHAHGFYGTTFDQWKLALAALKEAENIRYISVKPFRQHLDDLRFNADHQDPDGFIYACIDETYLCTPDTADYNLSAGSPCVSTGKIIPGIHDQPTPAADIDGKPVLFQPNMGPHDGRVTEIITEDDWTPARWTFREGGAATLKGGGHVNLGNLSAENENITCKLSGSAEITQFTPAGSNTKLKAVPGSPQVFNLGGGHGIFG
ncbi:MAG: hypothetical protein JEZ12_23605 [Desulfobacterium sp.]|nr:hypothetical protein [Desulfobacterium sp.]